MQDGATATFDLFEPLGEHRTGGDAFVQIYFFFLLVAVGGRYLLDEVNSPVALDAASF